MMYGAYIPLYSSATLNGYQLIFIAVVHASAEWPSRLTAIATAVGAFLAILALCGALYQLSQNRRVAREDRLYRYFSRQNATGEIEYEATVLDFLTLEGTPSSERIEVWEKHSKADQLKILHTLNFWEELAGMYNRNLVEKPVARDYWGETLLVYWDTAYWFISHLRKTQEPFMCELETLCIDVRRRELGGVIPPDRAVLPELLRRRAARRTMTASGPPGAVSEAVAPQPTGDARAQPDENENESENGNENEDGKSHVDEHPQPRENEELDENRDVPPDDEASVPPEHEASSVAAMAALGVGALIVALALFRVSRKRSARPGLSSAQAPPTLREAGNRLLERWSPPRWISAARAADRAASPTGRRAPRSRRSRPPRR